MRLTHSLLTSALAVTTLASDRVAAAAADDGPVCMRGGVGNLLRSLPPTPSGGNRARVMYFGGGSVAGVGVAPDKGYAPRLTGLLRKAFRAQPLAEYNKGLERTDSWAGAFRTETEIVRHYIALKLVVLDFAADDLGLPEARVKAAVEGIVRQIRRQHQSAEILFLYSLRREFLDDFAAGKTPEVIQWHEQVAEHYGITSVNMARSAAARIAAGELTFDDISRDGRHPTEKGHDLYADMLGEFVDQCREAETPGELVAYTLPEPLTPRPLEEARLVSYEKGKLGTGWLGWQESPVDLFFHVVRCNEPGPVLSLRFRGAAVGYFDVLGPDSGALEFAIDDGSWQTERNFDERTKAGYRPHAGFLAEGLDPNREHVVKLRVAAPTPVGSTGRWVRLAEFLVDGQVVFDDPHGGKSPLGRIDGMWAGMEPIAYTPPADRWQCIPNTMEKLRQGPELRIVMLGDSIVNDTAHSLYEQLLMRLYPSCTVHKKVSVRGSTGCWWYQEEGRVQTYVLEHDPDLLMIGGISQRNDIDAIRSVIHQVRGARPDTEFLLMTGPFGNYDPRSDKDWSSRIDPDNDTYEAKLMKLAAEETCEFFDMRGAWGDYIRASKWALGAFKRDRVHANDRGKQTLGRLLEAYFAPKR